MQNNPHFGLLPPYPPLSPSFCYPHMKFDPYPKNVLDLPIRKKYNQWRNMECFLAIVFRCRFWSNVAKYSKSSPMMSSLQDMPFWTFLPGQNRVYNMTLGLISLQQNEMSFSNKAFTLSSKKASSGVLDNVHLQNRW